MSLLLVFMIIMQMQREVLSPKPSPTSIADTFLISVKENAHPLGNVGNPIGNSPTYVSSFVINTLFNALTVACLSGPDTQKLDLWFISYR